MSDGISAMVEWPLPRRALRARYRRWQIRRRSSSAMANCSWHANLWYQVHRVVLWALVGENGYEPRIRQLPRPVHAWFCARWVPEWQAYLDGLGKS